MTQIYSDENGVQKISLEPYFSVTKTEYVEGENNHVTNWEGIYGMGNGDPIKFTRKLTYGASSGVMKFETSDAGNFANTLWGVIVPDLNGLDFQEDMYVEVQPEQMKLQWGCSGHVDNKKFDLSETLQITNLKQSR